MKQLILILIILTAGYVCHAQLRPPVQTDTLEIISVKYNYMDIDKENWPCQFIYKSTTGFNICGQEFRIVDVVNNFSEIEFTLSDASAKNEQRYKLLYSEDERFITYGKKVKTKTIIFSKYEFECIDYSSRQDNLPSGTNGTGTSEENISFNLVEIKPSFMGGDANTFSKWVNDRLVYPAIAKENGVQGKVTLQFTINTDGILSNVKVLRGVDPSLDKEAVRVVSMSPKWTPGSTKGQAVSVTYTFPVVFHLGSESRSDN